MTELELDRRDTGEIEAVCRRGDVENRVALWMKIGESILARQKEKFRLRSKVFRTRTPATQAHKNEFHNNIYTEIKPRIRHI